MDLIRHPTEAIVRNDASDVHLKVGLQPTIRIHGIAAPARRGGRRSRTRRHGRASSTCCSTTITAQRFRSAHPGRPGVRPPSSAASASTSSASAASISMVIRVIPSHIRTSRSSTCRRSSSGSPTSTAGLILVTGTTGSGKSTTLAAMIDHINRDTPDPHHHDRGSDRVHAQDQRSIINQREVGYDTHELRGRAARPRCARTPTSSWSARCATSRRSRPRSWRPRPVTWCMSTLHTLDAPETITRTISPFPSISAIRSA